MVKEMDNYDVISVDALRSCLNSDMQVLMLDCRPNNDFRTSHIVGAYSIVLPQIMMRRLRTSKLPLKNLVPPNLKHEKEAFLRKCLTSDVVLYDDDDPRVDVEDPSLLELLLKRLKEEGSSVFVLRGGFSAFQARHPACCIASRKTSFRDEENRMLEESSATPLSERCSPASASSQLSSSILGLGSLQISCYDETDNLQFHPPPFRQTSPYLESCNPMQRNDRFNSIGESDYPNSATSVSSSDFGDRNKETYSCVSPLYSSPRNDPKLAPLSRSGPPGHINAVGPIEILPGLFLGSAKDAASKDTLTSLNIRYILNVTSNLPNVFEADESFAYKQIFITDHWSQNLSQFFPEAISFIGELNISFHIMHVFNSFDSHIHHRRISVRLKILSDT